MYPSKYIIIPDTNILWNEEKDVVVNEDFSSFWEEYSSKFNFELAVPYVVKGELLFQQATSANNHLKVVTKNIDGLNNIINKNRSFKLTENEIKKYVGIRFDKWLKGLKGTIIKTPVDDINLNKIIELSIWREKPFKKLENDKKEKTRLDDGGFRDAMILESIVKFSQNSQGVSVAFLCNDMALRSAADGRIGDQENFSLHESIDDFVSYAKLLHEDLEKEFVSQILSKARSKFYTRGDENCVWNKYRIGEAISLNFPDKLKPEEGKVSPLSGLFNLGGELSSEWTPSQDFSWSIVRTKFGEKKGDREYHWNTIVKFKRMFEREGIQGMLDFPETPLARALALKGRPEEKIRVRKNLQSEFEVRWKVDVSPKKRFSKLELNEMEFVRQELLPPINRSTDED